MMPGLTQAVQSCSLHISAVVPPLTLFVVAYSTVPRMGEQMRGVGCGSHTTESNRDGVTRKFTQLRNTLHDARAYCCLSGIMWATSVSLHVEASCLESA